MPSMNSTMADTGLVNELGTPLRMNKEYVQADKRILLGFIEPHFMAGFSGGLQSCFPWHNGYCIYS